MVQKSVDTRSSMLNIECAYMWLECNKISAGTNFAPCRLILSQSVRTCGAVAVNKCTKIIWDN